MNITPYSLCDILLPYQIYSDSIIRDADDDHHLTCPQLRYFAREAQLTGDYEQAALYYQEVRTPQLRVF